MRPKETLQEQVQRGEPGYPFAVYHASPFVSEHWHEELELIHVLGGVLQLHINGAEYVGRAGDVFIVNRNEIHSMSVRTPETAYKAFVFDLSMLLFAVSDLCQKQFLLPLTDGRMRLVNRPAPTEALGAVLQRLAACQAAKAPGYRLTVRGALLEGIGLLLAEGQYTADATGEDAPKTQLMKRIVSYIDAHCAERITLASIAAECNMAPKYFCRVFKQHFQMTLVEYVNSKRVEQAARLLSHGEQSVTEVALTCGFSNTSYFTRLFKRFTGYTPSGYRGRR